MVYRLLKENPPLRVNTKKLIWCVYLELGIADGYSISFNKLLEAPSPESITRTRRAILSDCTKPSSGKCVMV